MDLETWNILFTSKISDLRHPGHWTLGLANNVDKLPGWKQFTLHAPARFTCSVCGRRWESSKVRIIFNVRKPSRRVPQGCVNMRVFKQECQRCNVAQLEEPVFLIENIDISLDWLVMRIRKGCYGEDVSDRQAPEFMTSGRADGPHDSAHCEACHLGVCSRRTQVKKQHDQLSATERRSRYEEWDALMERGYGHLRDDNQQPLIHNERRARRGSDHHHLRLENEVENCCPCVLL